MGIRRILSVVVLVGSLLVGSSLAQNAPIVETPGPDGPWTVTVPLLNFKCRHLVAFAFSGGGDRLYALAHYSPEQVKVPLDTTTHYNLMAFQVPGMRLLWSSEPTRGFVHQLAVSPAGGAIVVVTTPQFREDSPPAVRTDPELRVVTIRAHNPDDGRLLWTLPFTNVSSNSVRLALSPDGRTLAMAGCSYTQVRSDIRQMFIRLIDVATREVRGQATWEGFEYFSSIAFHPTKPLLATGQGASELTVGRRLMSGFWRLWDIADGTPKQIWESPYYPSFVMCLCFNGDGTRVAVGYLRSTDDRWIRAVLPPGPLQLWDTDKRAMMWFAAGMDPRALAFSGGGAVLLCAGAGPIQCYDHVTATLTGLYKDLTYHQFEVHRLSVGGNYLAFDQVDPKEGLLSEWKPNCRFQVWSLPMFLDASRNQITKH